jgi:hypothetical protein
VHSLTTRARALAYHRAQLLAGCPAPKPRPDATSAYITAQARRVTLWLLLAGALRPGPTASLSLESAPSSSFQQPALTATVSQSNEN